MMAYVVGLEAPGVVARQHAMQQQQYELQSKTLSTGSRVWLHHTRTGTPAGRPVEGVFFLGVPQW